MKEIKLRIRYAISLLLLLLICLNASFSFVRNVPDWQVSGKWIGTYVSMCVGLMVYSIMNTLKPRRQIVPDLKLYSIPMIIVNVLVSVCCLLQIEGIIDNNTPFVAVSDFDNPAGVATLLCLTFPFSISLNNKVCSYKTITILVLFIDVIVLILIQSRVGLLAILSSVLLYLFYEIKNNSQKNNKLLILILTILLFAIICLSVHKVASTRGRWLILKICSQMIADRPFFGHGLHGFAREYMLYQAEYLRVTDIGNYHILTDNINHPLSEFVLLTVNYGFFGLLLVLFISFSAIKYIMKKEIVGKTAFAMMAIGLFELASFSYPFRYPITTISLLFCFMYLFSACNGPTNVGKKKILSYVAMVLIPISLLGYFPWYKSQIAWKKIIDEQEWGGNSLLIYNYLIPTADKTLKNNPRYLYTRAVAEYFLQDYDKSLSDALKSNDKISSYNTELLLGNIYRKKGLFDISEKKFKMASDMCPSKITPLYNLFKLYEEKGDSVEMRKVGKELLDKPVKKQSRETRAMRFDVKKSI